LPVVFIVASLSFVSARIISWCGPLFPFSIC
jgi:hypothetical protein